MDVQAMKRQGLTDLEIAEATGYHRETIGEWLRNGGPPPTRTKTTPPAIDERRAARIAELLRPAPRLLATSVFEILVAEGYDGSYPTVARHLNALRGPRFRAAAQVSTRIETAPGGGVPVRLVRHRRLELRVGSRRGAVPVDDLVLEPLAAVVVRIVDRPGAHLRRTGSGLRGLRWRAQGGPHRPHGRTGQVPGPSFHLVSAGSRVRPVPRL